MSTDNIINITTVYPEDEIHFSDVNPLRPDGVPGGTSIPDTEAYIFNSGLTLSNAIPANTLTFPGINKPAVIINFTNDPPTIIIDESLSWDQAAKHFWNAVYHIMGKPAPFDDI